MQKFWKKKVKSINCRQNQTQNPSQHGQVFNRWALELMGESRFQALYGVPNGQRRRGGVFIFISSLLLLSLLYNLNIPTVMARIVAAHFFRIWGRKIWVRLLFEPLVFLEMTLLFEVMLVERIKIMVWLHFCSRKVNCSKYFHDYLQFIFVKVRKFSKRIETNRYW